MYNRTNTASGYSASLWRKIL